MKTHHHPSRMIARKKRTVTTHHWDRQNACCGVSHRGSRLSFGDHVVKSVTVPDRTAPEPKMPKQPVRALILSRAYPGPRPVMALPQTLSSAR